MSVYFILGIVVIVDQITKFVIRHTMTMGQSIPVLGDIVRITYVENPGMAFGIRMGSGILFTILSSLASLGIAVYLFTHRQEGMQIKLSLSLILGGAIGNLIDRIAYGQVVDFVDVGIGSLRWPVFNVADSTVVVGMAVLLFAVFVSERKERISREEAV